jgi:hypothetical protein
MKYENIEAFNEKLDEEPAEGWVETNEIYKNKYIPLRIVEGLLKEIFGIVQYRKSGNIMIVGNNAVYSIDVVVMHPVLKEWIVYNGVSSIPITLDENGNTANLHSHLPMAKAFAITNATRYIGRIFGSHLNENEDKVEKEGSAAGMLSSLSKK